MEAPGGSVNDLLEHMGRVTMSSQKAQHERLLTTIGEQRFTLNATLPEASRRAASAADLTRRRPATVAGASDAERGTSKSTDRGLSKSSSSTAPPITPFRLPHMDDMAGPGWQAPPDKNELKKSVDKSSLRRFNKYSQCIGTELHPQIGKLKPKVLNQWTQERAMMPSRNFEYPKHHPGFRFNAQSESIQEPTDDMLHPQHGAWLAQHKVKRDKDWFPIYYAMDDLDKANAIKAGHDERKLIARDLLSRRQINPPQFSARVSATIKKIKMAVKVSHAFHANAGVKNSSLAEEEKEDKARIIRCETTPALHLRPPSPEGRPKHMNPMKGTDRTGRHLRTTTPGPIQDEARAVKNRMRATFS